MRTHSDIIKSAGIAKVVDAIPAPENTVRAWIRRDKVPDEHWHRFDELGFATLAELATYAAHRKAA